MRTYKYTYTTQRIVRNIPESIISSHELLAEGYEFLKMSF